MTYSQRITTLRVIIDGHHSLSASPKLSQITGELNRISTASRVPKHSGWLLSVVHTTRALDTTLSEILKFKGWPTNKYSIGAYIRTLYANRVLSFAEKERYQEEVVDKRNKYMHEAGAMPTQQDADKILAEMHVCLVVTLSRL